MSLTIYECHSLADRTPLASVNTLVGAAAFVASYATVAGWQIAFWQIDENHPDCADAILTKGADRKIICAEPDGL